MAAKSFGVRTRSLDFISTVDTNIGEILDAVSKNDKLEPFLEDFTSLFEIERNLWNVTFLSHGLETKRLQFYEKAEDGIRLPNGHIKVSLPTPPYFFALFQGHTNARPITANLINLQSIASEINLEPPSVSVV